MAGWSGEGTFDGAMTNWSGEGGVAGTNPVWMGGIPSEQIPWEMPKDYIPGAPTVPTVSWDSWLNRFNSATGPGTAYGAFPGLKPTALGLARTTWGFGADVADADVLKYVQQYGMPQEKPDESFMDSLVEMGTPLAVMAALAYGGNALFGASGATAGTGAEFAGGGEVGSGYAASAPGMTGPLPSWARPGPSLSGPASVVGPDGVARSAISGPFGFSAPSGGVSMAGDPLLAGGGFAGTEGFSGFGAEVGPQAFSELAMNPAAFEMNPGVLSNELAAPTLEGAYWDTGAGFWNNIMKEMSPSEILKRMKQRPLASIFNVGTGLYGLSQARDLQKMAAEASRRADPFGPERAQYAAKLRQLYADPSRVQDLPGYKAGLQAVERKMASQGYNNSGNMMLALHDYGGRMFDAEANRLAQLAGAGFGPNAAAEIMGASQAAALRGQALNRIGLGVLR